MQKNDAGVDTVEDYLKELLLKLWDEGECFSGKRPFGNSGWEYELYHALALNGLVEGEIDPEYGDLVDVDEVASRQFIRDLILGASF
jgi:hypothetical protein